MNSKIYPSLFALLFSPLPAFAEDDLEIQLRGVAGISHMSVDESHIELTPSRTDTLEESSENAFQGGLGVVLGMPLADSDEDDDDLIWFPDIKAGVMGYGLGHTVSGEQLQYGQTDLEPSEYHLDIDNFRLMFDVFLTVASWEDVFAFLIGGAGASWNWVEYKDTSPGSLTISIEDERTTTFAWEVGAGIGYQLTENLSISAQYLFTDFGKLKTGDDASNSAGNFEVEPAEFQLRTNTAFLGLEWTL